MLRAARHCASKGNVLAASRWSASVASVAPRGFWSSTGLANSITAARGISTRSTRKFAQLEREANASPGDAFRQATYLQALVTVSPDKALRRFESGQFASNEECVKEYIKALVKTDRLNRVDIQELMRHGITPGAAAAHQASTAVYGQAPGSTWSAGAPAAAWGMAGGAAAGESVPPPPGADPKDPLYVVFGNPSWQTQLWRTARGLLIGFLVVSGVGALLEDRGLGGRGQAKDHEVNQAQKSGTTFKDALGVDEAKQELEEVVAYLRDPSKFTTLGGKLPKGVLLTGPPGTGKTLLARAVAGEAGVPFFAASGSEFEEMYVGVGARRVRDLFQAAQAKAPCMIFIDEIDAIGGTRNPKDQQHAKMTLNELLVQLDGFQQIEGVIVIAATNFPRLLDPALTRPGRFDRNVHVPLPDIKGREEILKHYLDTTKISDEVNVNVLARGTPGFSGAELANMVNLAAIRAASEGEDAVSMAALEHAKDKLMMGAERKSAVIAPEVRKLTAYHEGGHAIVAHYTQGAHPIHKATIMPRGQALGMVHQLPHKDVVSVSVQMMKAELDVCMGGRVAEELIFGKEHVTGGASSDIQRATQVAEQMVTTYGMSTKVGPVYYSLDSRHELSSETRAAIDSEVRRLLEESRARATEVLTKNKSKLHKLANLLLEEETLSGTQINDLLNGGSGKVKAKASSISY